MQTPAPQTGGGVTDRYLAADNAIVLGAYRSQHICDHVQFFSCDLDVQDFFETSRDLPPGLWVGALFSGAWISTFGTMEYLFTGNGAPHVISCGEPIENRDRPAARHRLRMASYLIGQQFFATEDGAPGGPLNALAAMISPGVHRHFLKNSAAISDSLLRLMNNPYSGEVGRLFVESTVLASIFHLAHVVSQTEIDTGRRSTLVAQARYHIDSALEGTLSLRTLAAQLGSNETTLQRRFKSETGITVFQYVLQRRMQAARVLVRDDHLQIAEIAFRVGYRSAANFSTAYKRFHGASPMADRC